MQAQRDEDFSAMEPEFGSDFELFPLPPGHSRPFGPSLLLPDVEDIPDLIEDVKTIRAKGTDLNVLKGLRRVLAMQYTTVYRWEALCDWYTRDFPNAKDTKLGLGQLDIARTKLERVKYRVQGNPLVELYDKANTFSRMDKLADGDGENASNAIAACEPIDRVKDSKTNWKTIFNAEMAHILETWTPGIADIEDDATRNARQQYQIKVVTKSAEDREGLRATKQLDKMTKKGKGKAKGDDADPSEHPILIAGEDRLRRKRESEEMTRLKAMAKAKGQPLEEEVEEDMLSETESVKTVTSAVLEQLSKKKPRKLEMRSSEQSQAGSRSATPVPGGDGRETPSGSRNTTPMPGGGGRETPSGSRSATPVPGGNGRETRSSGTGPDRRQQGGATQRSPRGNQQQRARGDRSRGPQQSTRGNRGGRQPSSGRGSRPSHGWVQYLSEEQLR